MTFCVIAMVAGEVAKVHGPYTNEETARDHMNKMGRETLASCRENTDTEWTFIKKNKRQYVIQQDVEDDPEIYEFVVHSMDSPK